MNARFVTKETWPAAWVWLVILAQVRELAERAITVAGTAVAGLFAFVEADCEPVCASREPVVRNIT